MNAGTVAFWGHYTNAQNRTLRLRGANLLPAVKQFRQPFASRIPRIWPSATSRTPNTRKLLLELGPQYFAPEAFVAITAGPTEIAELLRPRFDFIFFTRSVRVAKIALVQQLKIGGALHLAPHMFTRR